MSERHGNDENAQQGTHDGEEPHDEEPHSEEEVDYRNPPLGPNMRLWPPEDGEAVAAARAASTPCPHDDQFVYEVGVILVARADVERFEKLSRGRHGLRRDDEQGKGSLVVRYRVTANPPEVVDELQREVVERNEKRREDYEKQYKADAAARCAGHAPAKPLKGREPFEAPLQIAVNRALGVHSHGPIGPDGPPELLDRLGNLPKKRWLPRAGEGVKVIVVDTGLNLEKPGGGPDPVRVGWFDGRATVGSPADEDDPLVPDPLDSPTPPHALPPARYAGHGNFVAGTVLIHAPGAQVRLVKVQTQDPGGRFFDGELEATINGLDALGHLDIVNMSFGAPDLLATKLAVEQLVRNRPGVALVASAGNDNASTPCQPAAMKSVIGVAAIGEGTDVKADFSNFGPWVDACAPGVDCHSVYLLWQNPFPKPFAKWSGTSFAAPTVAGAIAAELSPPGLRGLWRSLCSKLLSLCGKKKDSPRQVGYRMLYKNGSTRLTDLGTVVRPKRYAN